MSESEGRAEEFDELEENQNKQPETIIPISVTRGQPYNKDDSSLLSVILSQTLPKNLFVQQPTQFAADGQEAARVTKLNENYDVACKKMLDPGQAISEEIQTIEQPYITVEDNIITDSNQFVKEKCTNTENPEFTNFSCQTNYVDIMQLIPETEDTVASPVQQDDKTANLKQNNETGSDFDEQSTQYTKTATEDETASETATAYTTGTTGTTQQSVGSLDSKLHDGQSADSAQQLKLSTIQQKMYTNDQFLYQLQLTELLVNQFPLLKRDQLYRATDIAYDPQIDYRVLLRQEFTVNKSLDNQTNAITTEKLKQQQKQDKTAELKVQLLFTYKSSNLQQLSVTCMDFSPIDERLICVGYSSLYNNGQQQIQSQQLYGAIAVFMPENPTYPKQFFFTKCPVSSLQWLPIGKSVIAVGFDDGTVAVFDFRHITYDMLGYAVSNLESTNKTGKHSSRVTDLKWCAGDISGAQIDPKDVDYDNLISISTDGRVAERSIKRSFEYRDILTLTAIGVHPVAIQQSNDKKQSSNRMTIIRKLSAGLSIDFLPDQTTYLLGGDDALIRKASRAYSEQTLQAYKGHLSSIYAVRVNPCCPDYFLSCSADRTAKIWQIKSQSALVTLKSPALDHIYCAEWCPFKSTLLCCGSKAGVVELWDLSESTVQPKLVIDKILQKKADEDAEQQDVEQLQDQPTIAVKSVKFNKNVPILAVGYDNGWVSVYRLVGVENGFIEKNIDEEEFLQIESERIETVVQQQEGNKGEIEDK